MERSGRDGGDARPHRGSTAPRHVALLVAVAALGLLLGACSSDPGQGSDPDPAQVDAVAPPADDACRRLVPDDLTRTVNATRTVACTEDHTAQTLVVGRVPDDVAGDGPDGDALVAWTARTCAARFADHLGASESTALRTVLGWAWFGPSRRAWDDGARWYRCDLVGGGPTSPRLATLPGRTRGLLAGLPADRWMACARGASVQQGRRVSCAQPHDWRAVTTIRLGEARTAYPGDDAVERRTRQFCADSVAAWLRYPASYDYGYTWFGAAEWSRGNRRSVCWARTSR